MHYMWCVAKGQRKNIQNFTNQCYMINVIYLECGKRPPQEHLEFYKSMLCAPQEITSRICTHWNVAILFLPASGWRRPLPHPLCPRSLASQRTVYNAACGGHCHTPKLQTDSPKNSIHFCLRRPLPYAKCRPTQSSRQHDLLTCTQSWISITSSSMNLAILERRPGGVFHQTSPG